MNLLPDKAHLLPLDAVDVTDDITPLPPGVILSVRAGDGRMEVREGVMMVWKLCVLEKVFLSIR